LKSFWAKIKKKGLNCNETSNVEGYICENQKVQGFFCKTARAGGI
jgi:hypothetical protein